MHAGFRTHIQVLLRKSVTANVDEHGMDLPRSLLMSWIEVQHNNSKPFTPKTLIVLVTALRKIKAAMYLTVLLALPLLLIST